MATFTPTTLDLRTERLRPLAAVRRWAELQGFESREGGWIYLRDEPYAQGWASFIDRKFSAMVRNQDVWEAARNQRVRQTKNRLVFLSNRIKTERARIERDLPSAITSTELLRNLEERFRKLNLHIDDLNVAEFPHEGVAA